MFAPLHGADAAPVQVVLPADVEQGVGVRQAVHVEMEQGNTALVLIDDGEGGAGDPAAAAQAPGEAPGECGLAHAQSAGVRHHGTGGQHGGKTGAQILRLRHAVGNIFQKQKSFLSNFISIHIIS